MLEVVPKRTNLFQQVVSVIYEHLADGASIEESAMLPNRLTGKKREVGSARARERLHGPSSRPRARVFVDRPGEGVKWSYAPQNLDVFIQDGMGHRDTYQCAHRRSNLSDRINEQIDLPGIVEDMDT
jgi:hypothetical protein